MAEEEKQRMELVLNEIVRTTEKSGNIKKEDGIRKRKYLKKSNS
jgi:hypothetical protein